MKIMKTANNFTEGKIFSPLVRFALPVLLAMFLQSMYGAVDTLIVGQFGSAADVSAVATGGGIMQTITMAIVGISMGTTILLGQRIGEGRTDKAGDVIGSSILLFLIIGLGVTVLMEIFTVPAAQIMQAPEEAFGGTVSYVRICSAGTIFIIAYNVLGSVFRGMGNSKMPLITVAISCVLNIGGDILLVGVFKMAAAGAAIATVASQAVSVVLSILIIKKQGLPFEFGRKNPEAKKGGRSWRNKAGAAYSAPGCSCERILSGHNGNREFTGRYCFGGSGRCRKDMRLYYAGSFGLFPVNLCVCRSKYRG